MCMGIKQTLDVINAMERDGVIERYAIGGAVAAYNYVEPAVTEDLDIFLSIESTSPIITLEPILKYLRQRGYKDFRKEGIEIEGWPVQFIPASDALAKEAIGKAEPTAIRANGGKVKARIMRAEHLVALALRVSRPKDLHRIGQFLDETAVNLKKLDGVLARHDLRPAWQGFCRKTGRLDPIAEK
jgi:hypothetical protein